MINATNSVTTAGAGGSTASAVNSAGAEDRFLKLLVAQLNNQDPMNPMDNAQMTSQMAQISTVSSVQQVNQTLQGLASQLSALQMLQGGSLVGRSVLVQGSTLTPENGVASGAFDLALAADNVKIDIVGAGGQVVDSFTLGRLAAGRHDFDWDASAHPAVGATSYRVTATQGAANVGATLLVRDRIDSVGLENGAMSVRLHGLGNAAYESIKAIL
jgi:flagellar basal-body rod modification protein FlgD